MLKGKEMKRPFVRILRWAVGIFLAAGIYGALVWVLNLLDLRPWALFGATAILMLPVALFYRPRETPRPVEAFPGTDAPG